MSTFTFKLNRLIEALVEGRIHIKGAPEGELWTVSASNEREELADPLHKKAVGGVHSKADAEKLASGGQGKLRAHSIPGQPLSGGATEIPTNIRPATVGTPQKRLHASLMDVVGSYLQECISLYEDSMTGSVGSREMPLSMTVNELVPDLKLLSGQVEDELLPLKKKRKKTMRKSLGVMTAIMGGAVGNTP